MVPMRALVASAHDLSTFSVSPGSTKAPWRLRYARTSAGKGVVSVPWPVRCPVRMDRVSPCVGIVMRRGACSASLCESRVDFAEGPGLGMCPAAPRPHGPLSAKRPRQAGRVWCVVAVEGVRYPSSSRPSIA